MPILTALDVVSVASIKQELLIDFTDDDALIERKIYAAVSLIEQETLWRFYPRTETMVSSANKVQIFQHPLNTVSAVNADSVAVTFDKFTWPLRVSIDFGYDISTYRTITLTTGASELTQIPQLLIEAIRRQVVYLYEERENNKAIIPDDVQEMISKFRRFTYF